MKYKIEGGNLPYLTIALEQGESIQCQSGAMSWMDDGITMQTKGGGIGKMFGRMVSGESMFLNHYVAERGGEITFSSHFPGSIMAMEVTPDRPVIIQKGAFLACTEGLQGSIHFRKKVGAGFFGGEGFIMQKFEGNGLVFLEIDGSAHTAELVSGQKVIIDTGYLAAMDSTCSMDIKMVNGAKNIVFGGEGLFNTVITGPGKVVIQSMPISGTAGVIAKYIPKSN